MQKEFYIIVSENEADYAENEWYYIVCVYEKDGDGTPFIEYYDETDISPQALKNLLADELAELGVTFESCEIVKQF